MIKHPLDRDREFNTKARAIQFARIARETAPEGSHPAVKAALKRSSVDGHLGDLARQKRLTASQ